MDSNTQCVILVLLEMGLSFSGIVCNLLVVTTLRHEERLKGSTLNYLLLNLCFSNLLISFLVKPISAIYVGYAISTGEWQVGLAFCTLYTFTYRTTWCIFPFTLMAMSWCKLLVQCRCGLCSLLCCCLRKSDPEKDPDQIDVALVERDGLGLGVVRPSEQRLLAPSPNQSEPATAGSVVNQPPLFTEIAMQYGSGTIRTGGSLLFTSATRDSLSTPTPSTVTGGGGGGNDNLQNSVNHSGNGGAQVEGGDEIGLACEGGGGGGAGGKGGGSSGGGTGPNNSSGSSGKKPKRTIEDGPTARQKLLLSFIWLFSAFFGVTTCFPDKVFGVAMSQRILEDQLRTIPPSAGTPRDMDLTYCTVKTGVNDLLDYIALMVSLVLPLLFGPVIVAVFQGFLSVFSRFFCGPTEPMLHLESAAAMAAGPAGAAIHSAAAQAAKEASEAAANAAEARSALRLRAALKRPDPHKGPGWGIIVGFTTAFLLTYPVHMYVAEVYVTEEDSFTFLIVKYCLGFLFVLFVPLLTLTLDADIRSGTRTVFGSAVLCLQDMDGDGADSNDQMLLPTEPVATVAGGDVATAAGPDQDQGQNGSSAAA